MLEPVAATVLAIAVLGEPAGPTTILGIATTLAGVWIASAVRSRQFAAIGIVKGETVAPDPGDARSWDEAVAVGNAASRALGMGPHRPVTSAASRVRVLGGKCFSSGNRVSQPAAPVLIDDRVPGARVAGQGYMSTGRPRKATSRSMAVAWSATV